jgi:hypothetical protein
LASDFETSKFLDKAAISGDKYFIYYFLKSEIIKTEF